VISHPTEVNLELSGFPITGAFAGYRIYRSVKGEPFSYQPHVSSPVMTSRYTDVGLEGGTSYLYAARIIVKLPSGVLVESGLSNQVEAQLKAEE
jgi:hypothetical protein